MLAVDELKNWQLSLLEDADLVGTDHYDPDRNDPFQSHAPRLIYPTIKRPSVTTLSGDFHLSGVLHQNYEIPEQVLFPEMPLPVRPQAPETHETQLLEQWEGTVQKVSATKFEAKLRSIINPNPSDEKASFQILEVPDADLPLIVTGAVFYWSVGYRKEKNGQKSLMSTIRFRRLPAWSKSDVDRAAIEAKKFSFLFNDKSSDTPRG